MQSNYLGQSASIKRIIFVLSYFMALNVTGYSKTPSLSTAKAIRKKLYMLSTDFRKVFGYKASYKFKVFKQFAKLLEKQIKTRELLNDKFKPKKQKTKGAKISDPALNPGRIQIEKLFKSMKKSSNSELFKTYENYAEGFFEHRIENHPDWAEVSTVDNVYNRPVRIGGARLAVCGDYAEIGKNLFKKAGATFSRYINRTMISDNEVLNPLAQYTDNHVIVAMKRNGKFFYISNETIYKTEDAAFEDIAFDNKGPTHKPYTGKGKTQKIASAAMLENVKNARLKLKRRLKKR